jgi:hypothetical protein
VNITGERTIASATRGATLLGFAGLGLSIALIVCLHVLASGQVDPFDETISDYVFSSEGWMLGVSALSLAVGGLGALIGLAGIGMVRSRAMRIAFSLLLLGLVLVAVFPTDRVGVVSLSAFVHRYSAGLVFFCLPIAGLLAATALTEQHRLSRYATTLRRTVWAAWVSLAVFLSSHLSLMPEFTRETLGISERVLFALELAVLAQLIYLPVRYRSVAS